MKIKYITWKFQVDESIPDPQMRQIMQRWMEEGQREYLPKEVRFDGFEVHPDGHEPNTGTDRIDLTKYVSTAQLETVKS